MIPRDKTIDFDRVARYYDAYVTADYDLPFWVGEASRHPGRRLELMCGTGRISLALLRAGLSLTCADYSAGLLAVLREKLARDNLDARVLELDARDIRLEERFDYVFIGFHSFSELAPGTDQLDALRSVARVLDGRGRFACALHNPSVRGTQFTGTWQEIGTFQLPDSENSVRVRGQYLFDPTTKRVEGVQRYTERNRDGLSVNEIDMPMQFHLPDRSQFEDLATRAGLRIETVWGDYGREPATATSPYLIFTCTHSSSGAVIK